VIEYTLAIENGKRYAPYTRSTDDKNQFAVWCIDIAKPILLNDVAAESSQYIPTTNIGRYAGRRKRSAAAGIDDLSCR
jgi:hypothetical protein